MVDAQREGQGGVSAMVSASIDTALVAPGVTDTRRHARLPLVTPLCVRGASSRSFPPGKIRD